MVPDTKENRQMCICANCPSYPVACKGEILYCSDSIGKSRCDILAAGCICPSCPVFFKYSLTGIYFCDKEPVGENRHVMRKKHPLEDASFYQTIVDIKDIAATGRSIVRSMGSLKRMPVTLDELHFVPAQVAKMPLNAEEAVSTEVVIGAKAKRSLRVSSPVMISGMSYGATSKSVRTVISRTAAALKIAFNAGEGGILEEELNVAGSYLMGQYATGRFGVGEERLKRVAAIEMRFGQGAYPGKGSYLPASKMTPEIAAVRGLKGGEAAYSPAHHHDMRNAQEVSEKVAWLRTLTGAPIGAKIGCGNVEADVRLLVEAGVDFIALDGFGGGTGATDAYVRDNVGIPIIAALPRAAKTLDETGARQRVSLIAGGGLRTSADFAKCIALGADAVYIGTAALIAINCEQYRICHTGLCPTGVTTHVPALEKQLDVERGVAQLSNFITACTREVAMFARIVGKDDVKKLDAGDLVALTREAAALTGVRWMDGE